MGQALSLNACSSARDTWLMGAGPFRKGTIRQGTEFAGQSIPLPAFGSDKDLIAVHELDGGTELCRVENVPRGVGCLAFSPDGSRLASGMADTSVLIWNLRP